MSFLFNKDGRGLKVLFVAPEASPFAKAGGLGEVMFALPRALSALGHDARVMIPRYAGINLDEFQLAMEYAGLEVPTGASGEKDTEPEYLVCNVRKYSPEGRKNGKKKLPVTTYFLENEEYYEKRSNVYGYSDDAVRWALLSRGVLEFLKKSNDWVPDVIVASDWQTGFISQYLRTEYKDNKKLASIATVFMIHNLYYQGLFDHHFVSEMDFDDGQSTLPAFFDPRFLKINGMRRGIMNSDVITTVSPTYAQEIMTKAFGELLEDLLKERRSRVYGVLNGIDYSDFDPENDSQLPKNYSESTLQHRAKNKEELQARFGLPQKADVPVVAIVSRLVEQKGFDLLFSVIEPLLKELQFQLVVLGSGEAKYMGFFKDLMDRYPEQVSAHLTFDPILPRLIYGGADMVLIPSRFEPCGLVQMEAMRYGVVPIVRGTGGLADSVTDYNAATGKGTGFIFGNFDSMSLAITLARACEHYRNPEAWKSIQKQAMAEDFSWEHSARAHAQIFETALDIHERHHNK